MGAPWQTVDPQAQIALPLHRLDVETYNRIVASGALEGQRIELLDGVLVPMSPQSPAHSVVVTRLMRHFAAAPQWWTQVQMPLEVSSDSEPEPDLAVHAEEPPPGEHPRRAELVVEVAVSSQMVDRNVKAAKYATADIPVYWLVDVSARTMEVRTDPDAGGYRRCAAYEEGTLVPCPMAGVAKLDVATLLAGVQA